MIRTLYTRIFGIPEVSRAPRTPLMLGTSFEVDSLQFSRHLQQAIGWMSMPGKVVDFQDSFYRSVIAGATGCNGDQLYRIEGDAIVWMPDAYCKDVYQEVLAQALKGRGRYPATDLSGLDRLGRILMYTTCISNTDTGLSAEGMCYIEERDIPPVDTWFYLKDGNQQFGPDKVLTLFCWIPKALEPAVHQAIDFEMMRHYNWLDEYAPAFYRRLKQGY